MTKLEPQPGRECEVFNFDQPVLQSKTFNGPIYPFVLFYTSLDSLRTMIYTGTQRDRTRTCAVSVRGLRGNRKQGVLSVECNVNDL